MKASQRHLFHILEIPWLKSFVYPPPLFRVSSSPSSFVSLSSFQFSVSSVIYDQIDGDSDDDIGHESDNRRHWVFLLLLRQEATKVQATIEADSTWFPETKAIEERSAGERWSNKRHLHFGDSQTIHKPSPNDHFCSLQLSSIVFVFHTVFSFPFFSFHLQSLSSLEMIFVVIEPDVGHKSWSLQISKHSFSSSFSLSHSPFSSLLFSSNHYPGVSVQCSVFNSIPSISITFSRNPSQTVARSPQGCDFIIGVQHQYDTLAIDPWLIPIHNQK